MSASPVLGHLPDPSHREYRGMPKRFRKDDVTRCVSCGEPWPCTTARSAAQDQDTNEWWLLRCLEEAVRDIDRLTNELSTDFNAISDAFMRKNRALTRLDEVRNG